MENNYNSSFTSLKANIIILITLLSGIILATIPGIKYFSWLLPLIIYLLEKKNSLIKFYASQALVIYLINSIITGLSTVILNFITIPMTTNVIDYLNNFQAAAIWVYIISLITGLINVILLILTVIASVKGWNYEQYEIPIIYRVAKFLEKILNKLCKDNNTFQKAIENNDTSQKN